MAQEHKDKAERVWDELEGDLTLRHWERAAAFKEAADEAAASGEEATAVRLKDSRRRA